jgi:hypothetical protein
METILINGASQTFAPIPAGPAVFSVGAASTGNKFASSNVSASDIIRVDGTLGGNTTVALTVPQFNQVVGTDALAGSLSTGWIKLIHNNTTGAHTLTITGTDNSVSPPVPGAGVVVPSGTRQWLYSTDGVNVYPAAPSV